MKRGSLSRIVTNSVILAALLSSSAALARERTIGPNQVPNPVHEAIARSYPHAKVVGYSVENEKGVVSYEVTFRLDGRPTDVEFSAEGRVLVQEDQISQTELPRKVSDALAASEYGRGSIERIERITEPEKDSAMRFEIVVRLRDRKLELTFDGDGRLVRKETIQRRQ